MPVLQIISWERNVGDPEFRPQELTIGCFDESREPADFVRQERHIPPANSRDPWYDENAIQINANLLLHDGDVVDSCGRKFRITLTEVKAEPLAAGAIG